MLPRLLRAALVLALALPPGAAAAGQVTPEAVDFGDARVVVMGEVHDNPAHHANQAAWVERLQPRALVFEMLTPELALKAANSGRMAREAPEALGRRLQWEARGWPDFALYAPIFAAAPDAEIFGGGVPRDEARRAVSDGAAAVLGGSAPLFGLDRPLDPGEAATRAAEQGRDHCGALPESLLPGMVEAQRLRDAALARATIAALEDTGGPVAVITGNGHARRDRGMPRLLDRARPDTPLLSIGQLEAPDPEAPYDLWTVTAAPPDRGDPCDAFR